MYRELSEAIVKQAVKDYRCALRGKGYEQKSAKRCVVELEQFFRSSYFELLTEVDGEKIITLLRKEHANERRTNSKHT